MFPETPSEKISRWLKVVLALCALAVLPQDVSHAQDFDAVERHLGVAVAEGMLTLEQASHMMEALRHSSQGEQHQAHEKAKAAHLEEVARKLKETVAAGKLSEADAKAKWQAIEKELHGIELAEIGHKLKAAVAKGELTEAEAKAKWEELEQQRKRNE